MLVSLITCTILHNLLTFLGILQLKSSTICGKLYHNSSFVGMLCKQLNIEKLIYTKRAIYCTLIPILSFFHIVAKFAHFNEWRLFWCRLEL